VEDPFSQIRSQLCTQAQLKAGIRTFYIIQQEVISVQKQPNCKNDAALYSFGKKKVVESKLAAKDAMVFSY